MAKKPDNGKKAIKSVQYKIVARKGSRFSDEDVQAMKPELEHIKEEHGGLLLPAAIAKFARENPTSELAQRGGFCWDGKEAIRKYNIFQARQIVNSIKYEIIRGKETFETGAYKTITNSGELPNAKKGRGYISLPTATVVSSFQEQILAQALMELKSFQARYKQISEVFTTFKPVFQAIAKIEKLIPTNLRKSA